MNKLALATVLLMLALPAMIQAASRPHVLAFGKPMTVKLFLTDDDSRPQEIKIRALYVDGKVKEFTTGDTHDITEQQFVVQRAYRVNDSLPSDERTLPKWRWQRGGWLLVDRPSARITQLRLPDFDPYYSDAAWYRDYAAYCGVSDTGDKLYAVVAQAGVRKPIVRQLLRPITGTGEPECGRPQWQRQPARVTFDVKEGQKLTFTIRGRAADLTPGEATAGNDESN